MTEKQMVEKMMAAIDKTRAELMRWAGGPQNNGPFSEEAYRTNIHIQAALNILASHIESAAEEDRANDPT